MVIDRKKRSGRRPGSSRRSDASKDGARPASGDSGGCLLVILAFLWWFGFLSFNWGRDRPEDRLEEIREELAEAEKRLSELRDSQQRFTVDVRDLTEAKATLEREVSRMESTREALAANLRSASDLIARGSSDSFWPPWVREIFTGVVGNVISHVLIFAVGMWLGAPWRSWPRRRARGGVDADLADEG